MFLFSGIQLSESTRKLDIYVTILDKKDWNMDFLSSLLALYNFLGVVKPVTLVVNGYL